MTFYERINIAFVAHLGDIVQHFDDEDEWSNAKAAMGLLDGVVPYTLAIGNHDMVGGGDIDDRTAAGEPFNRHFPARRFSSEAWYGGCMDGGNENSFCFFEAAGMEFMVLNIEYAPRDRTLEWANAIVARHSARRVIVVTHVYMSDDNTRIGRGSRWDPCGSRIAREDGNNGEEVWDKLVRQHANIFLVLSGHVGGSGAGRLTSSGVHGNDVHQLLSNYQQEPNGGNGWLRLMKFVPPEDRIGEDVLALSGHVQARCG